MTSRMPAICWSNFDSDGERIQSTAAVGATTIFTVDPTNHSEKRKEYKEIWTATKYNNRSPRPPNVILNERI